ncbi:dTDP-4-dehydrorhamnose reductase [Paraliomyxa miuraensis]|uniref:dTDP-4-dehydrorhamnose reductase n=1 Tax=Paraliomyxa miuraensis TaxID=376150 RepID=UPI002252488A|nr:dTDP-4-dehydrorhamnose reductase [Paraliomyxa miuraensis]MCX4241002.1 dTDP-4-dehydrorhamnose reductase [Paraliomyxa miuraensis]
MASNPARILLLGADGMLGRAWDQLARREGLAIEPRTYPAFDLTRREHVAALPIREVDAVINCTGWTDVDGAETHEAQATALNGDGVGWLAEACRDAGRDVGRVLVHYSTDYVFEGDATAPYAVDHPRAPLNAYGRSKAVGEERIEAALGGSDGGADPGFLLLRTSWLYAPWGNNFVRTMARLGKERSELRVVDDQRGRPTSAEHLAATSLALLRRGARGTLHVTDGGECTWYELARAVIERVDPTCRVLPCTSAEFPRPARRPSYSVLDLGPTEALVGPMPPWTSMVADVVARLPEGS